MIPDSCNEVVWGELFRSSNNTRHWFPFFATNKYEKIRWRKLDHKTKEQIRNRAVNLVEAGESLEDFIKTLVFHRSCIDHRITEYREGRFDALKERKITERPHRLSSSQSKNRYNVITSEDPGKLKFIFALWTRVMVVCIRDEFGVRIGICNWYH